LRPGMFARINAVFGERANARVVPEEAIVPQAGRQFVYRLVDGPDQDTKTAQRIEVKVGIRRPGRVEIVEGVQPGDLVVTAGQQRIQKDGMPVRVLDLTKTAGATPKPAGAVPAPEANGAAVAAAPAAPAAPAASAGISRVTATPKLNGPNPCLMASR
jgi:membrane fusion protein, multidrug efflux system